MYLMDWLKYSQHHPQDYNFSLLNKRKVISKTKFAQTMINMGGYKRVRILFSIVIFSDCVNHTTLTFVNITDSIVFHINGSHPHDTDLIQFHHMTGGSLRRKHIFDILDKTHIFYFDPAFTDRVLVQGNYTSTDVTVSIENSTRNDSGYYYIEARFGQDFRCFTVYILGEYFYLYRIT